MPATVNLAPLAKLRFVDNNGAPLAGGKVFTYLAGSTTKQASYTDSTGATPNSNPVILDSRGEASIWFDQTLAYKIVLAPATDTDPPTNPIWTQDGIPASGFLAFLALVASSAGASVMGFIQNATNAVVLTVQSVLREKISVMRFGAKGDNSTDDSTALQNALNWCFQRGLELEIPAGFTYKIGTGLTLTYDASGTQALRIRGGGGTNYNANGTGAVINFTHATADFLAITGDGPVMVDIEGLNFRGTGTGAAIGIADAWMVNIRKNTFQGMGVGVRVKAVTAITNFAGDIHIDDNRFEALQTAHILLTGDNGLGQINIVSIQKNVFLDGATHISCNWGGNTPDLHSIIIRGNDFENWATNAISFDTGGQSVVVHDNYFERDGILFVGQWINFATGGYNGLSICNNAFIGSLNAVNETLVYAINANGVKFLNNMCSAGGLTDRFSCDLVACTGVDVEPTFMQGTATIGYPVRVLNLVVASRVNETSLSSLPTGVGKFGGFSMGDGFPGASTTTLSTSQFTKVNGRVWVDLDLTLLTKSGVGSALSVGVIPYGNSGGVITFPLRTSGFSGGTAPYWGVLASNTFTIIDSAAAPLTITPTGIVAGATLKANFSFPTRA